jgi:hypothetical protein
MNDQDEVRAFITDPALQRRPAKYMVLQCFRNSMLEDLHAGASPSSVSGDFAEVHRQQSLRCHSVAESVASERRRNEATHDRCRRIEPTNSSTRCSMRIPGVKSCYAWQNVILCRTGTNRHFATKAARSNRPSRKPDVYRNYAKANNGCRDTPLSMTRLLFCCPALFTRSCCFHHALSTTSSATRATKSLQ